MGPNDIIRSGPFVVPAVGGREEEEASSPVLVVVVTSWLTALAVAVAMFTRIVTATDG